MLLRGALEEGIILLSGEVSGDPDGNGNINSYQWFLNDSAISDFRWFPSYATNANGAGTYKVAVTYTDAKGFIATVNSPDQAVAQVNNGSGTAGAITGNGAFFQEGVILTAPAITGDPDGNGTVTSYQWFLNDSAIWGATSSTYATSANSAGTYKVAVTYTDGQGFTETVDSPDQEVIKINPGKHSL